MHQNLTHFGEGADRAIEFINDYLKMVKIGNDTDDLQKINESYRDEKLSAKHFAMLRDDRNIRLKRLVSPLLQLPDCVEQWDILDIMDVLCTESAPHNFDFNCAHYYWWELVQNHTSAEWVRLTLFPVEWNGVLICDNFFVMGMSSRFYKGICKQNRPVPYIRTDRLDSWMRYVTSRGQRQPFYCNLFAVLVTTNVINILVN